MHVRCNVVFCVWNKTAFKTRTCSWGQSLGLRAALQSAFAGCCRDTLWKSSSSQRAAHCSRARSSRWVTPDPTDNMHTQVSRQQTVSARRRIWDIPTLAKVFINHRHRTVLSTFQYCNSSLVKTVGWLGRPEQHQSIRLSRFMQIIYWKSLSQLLGFFHRPGSVRAVPSPDDMQGIATLCCCGPAW